MFNSIDIQNFTVFKHARFEFVSGLNVLVGGNATGKTHVLKLLYAMQKIQYVNSKDNRDTPGVLLGTFRPEHIQDLVRFNPKRQTADVTAHWDAIPFRLAIDAETGPLIVESRSFWDAVRQPVFIPVKDMLAHSVGFLSLYEQRNIDFDLTHRDILSLAFLPTLRENARTDIESLLDTLAVSMEGHVEVKGERFYVKGKYGLIEIHMVAEGWRKLALLYQLIANGCIASGTVLFWDEPEANVNPSLMDEVVGVLLELSRRGVQIFLATHSYIILKELELQKRPDDPFRMFAMARSDKEGSVTVHPASVYAELNPNLIAEQFERIYDMEIDRALR